MRTQDVQGRTAAGSANAAQVPPTLREGAHGELVRKAQVLLRHTGHSPGPLDGIFGPHTKAAVTSFQRAHKLHPNGIVGPKTWTALMHEAAKRAGVHHHHAGAAHKSSGDYQPPHGLHTYRARGTGYYPDNSALEGGFKDRMGHPLHTLQAYLHGKAPYVSVAMDPKAFPYGTHLRIPELEKKYGRKIDFRVVDTGGAFFGKGTHRIDICTKSEHASLDPTINGTLHLVTDRRAG